MIHMANPILGAEERSRIMEVLDSGMLAHGKVVEEFEEMFASFMGVKYAVAVSSGTAALHTALLACGIGEGDEVITTPFSFSATANAILLAGAKPVFCDIDPITYNIDPSKIEGLITDKTKAILPVHLYGGPCDMYSIGLIADRHSLALIEDCAQAHDAGYNSWGKKVGAIGDAGCFSFYPTKNMTTSEGGMITTNSEDVARAAKAFRNHGISDVKYDSKVLGLNYRMTNIAAAIGIAQLGKLRNFNAVRGIIAGNYDSGLAALKDTIRTPYSNYKHAYHQYTLTINTDKISRDVFAEGLRSRGIGSETYYPILIPDQGLYKRLGYNSNGLDVARLATKQVISIPIRANLTHLEVEEIIAAIFDVVEGQVY